MQRGVRVQPEGQREHDGEHRASSNFLVRRSELSHPRGARRYLIANTETRGKQIVWSTHCHNDLGLATANSLAAVQQGARQIEVTLNGIGERAGNTSLEECVMALRTRQEHFPVYCGIDTKMIMKASKQARNYGAQ